MPTPAKADEIEQTEHRLWQVPGRVMVPPVFWKRLAYFYTSDSDGSATLRAYEYNPIIKAPELKCLAAMSSETSQSLYHQYSMVSVGDFGVIFKEQGGSSWTRYLCDPDAPGPFQQSSPSYADPAPSGVTAIFATTSLTSKTMVQIREDPENYVEGTFGDLYVIDTADSTVLGKAKYDDGSDTI